MKKFNDEDIIDDVVVELGNVTKKEAKRIFNSIFVSICDQLTEGSVSINGFGKFVPTVRTRRFWHIQNEEMSEAEKTKVQFSPSKGLVRYIRVNFKSDSEDQDEG